MSRLIIIFFAAALSLCAQDPRGTITGQVTDTSGAVVPGVSVRATNLETNVAAAAVSNAQGAYEILTCCRAATRWTPNWRGSRVSASPRWNCAPASASGWT